MSDWSTKLRMRPFFLKIIFLFLCPSLSRRWKILIYMVPHMTSFLFYFNFYKFVQELEKAFVKIRPKNNSKKPVRKVA